MLALLKIYFLFNLHFILTKCDPSQNSNDLSVRKHDKKLIEKKRQDTRDMCKMFNSEAIKAGFATEALPYNKYDKRKKELKLKEKEEKLQKIKTHRVKRALSRVNPALNVEDEQRVETIVDKIYDDLQEKGQKIAYRRKEIPKTEVKTNSSAAYESARRFPFAPNMIDGPSSTPLQNGPVTEPGETKPVRFVDAIVPYFIDARTYDTHLIEKITSAFKFLTKKTCIRLQRLRERPTDQKSLQNVIWLYITNPSGIRQCVHSNERAEIKGVQMVVFGYACMSPGDITHEIMHVLGFAHEHVRPDRDQHVTILWDNIKPGYRKYFEVHKTSVVEGLPYDYDSVMHYPPKAFSKNGQVTILTKADIKIGQREHLSDIDAEKIAMLYSNECNKREREYLLKTCPGVGKYDTETAPVDVPQQDIDDYFESRLWPYGVINYKLRDMLEFSSEEIENIKEVIRHIEKETCLEFRDLTDSENALQDLASSADNKFDTDEMDRLVILADSDENETTAILPDTSTSSEERVEDLMMKTIIDPVKTVRMDVKVKNISDVNGKAANTDVKEKDANVTKKPFVLRRKRAVPPLPSRRHVNNVVVLSRSPLPGCTCPRPGKPDENYLLKINTDCFNSANDLLHLFVHVLGLDHQHNMHDRDSFLHIVWDELTEDVKQEMKTKLPPAASVGFEYDYESVMHYPWLQIKNGKSNLMYPIWSDGWAMGQWQGLSSIDIQKIHLLYFKKCLERKQEESDKKDQNT